MGRANQGFFFNQNVEEAFSPELGRHIKHMDADLLRIIIQTGADAAVAIWRQNSAIQLKATPHNTPAASSGKFVP